MTHPDPKYQPGDAPVPENAPEGAIISADTRRENRVPPGQTRTRKWPVLHYGRVPHTTTDQWSLKVTGLVENPLTLDWNAWKSLPRVRVFADFHCVTRWSRLGNVWEGVSAREIMKRAGVKENARYVIAGGYDDGWTTNMPLADFDDDDVLLADLHDGEPLNDDHGGPVRLIVPKLYAWKSAKWVCSLEFSAEDKPGLWERAGYHNHGDPWVQNDQNPDGERFQSVQPDSYTSDDPGFF
ncbi:MAG: sulfite oxidase-like oxidoreductase [Planctomycetaceae bacterium]